MRSTDYAWKVDQASATISRSGTDFRPASLPMARQTTDDARWQAGIADFRCSGLTQPEFGRRRGCPCTPSEGASTPATAAESTPSVLPQHVHGRADGQSA